MDEFYLSPEDFARAKENGISERLLKQRFYSNGWTKERAINDKKNKRRRTKYPEELVETAKENGISESLLRYRVHTLKWSKYEASTIKPKKKETFLSIARKNGINPNTYYRRVYDGWTKKKASTTPTNKKFRRNDLSEVAS